MSTRTETTSTPTTAPVDGVGNWQRLVREQQETIHALQQTIEKMDRQLKQQHERIEQLEAELKEAQKLKGKPKIQPSRLNTPKPDSEADEAGKRPGSEKGSKKPTFQIDEERIIQPDEVPARATFNGYRDYDVQELILKRHNIRFRLAEYVDADGSTIVGQLPPEYRHGHYGPLLLGYVLYQHYQCRVPQPLLHEQLQEWGIAISTGALPDLWLKRYQKLQKTTWRIAETLWLLGISFPYQRKARRASTGQLNNILTEHQDSFHAEQQQVLRVGLETAE